MTTAWQFSTTAESIVAIEPDGTRHTVMRGDWGGVAGARLLNRMVEVLSSPPLCTVARARAPLSPTTTADDNLDPP